MSLETLLNEIDWAFEQEQVKWLEELVNQPSYTRIPEDVEAAALIIEKRMLEIGCDVEHVASDDFADHRVYSTPATGIDDQAILLAGHCDTVYPREQGFLEFTCDGDTIRGPGVLDMKSGLSVIVFALQAISRAAPEEFAKMKLRFVNNTDEEVGSPDSRCLYEKLAKKTTAALVFEGGRDGDRIITARKGTGGFLMEVTGREAHAGNQHSE
jgi:glutamate carboxypeptidase